MATIHFSWYHGVGNIHDWSKRYSFFSCINHSFSFMVQFAVVPAEIRSSWNLCCHVFGNIANSHQSINGLLYLDNCFWIGFLHFVVQGKLKDFLKFQPRIFKFILIHFRSQILNQTICPLCLFRCP